MNDLNIKVPNPMLVLKDALTASDFSTLHSKWKELPEKIRLLSDSIDHPTWVWSNHDFPVSQSDGESIPIVPS